MIPSVLLTDLYQLTMANGYFRLGLHNKQACFQQFFRRNPFGSGYTIAAGLEDALSFLADFHFSNEDLEYLSSLKTASNNYLFEANFIDYLRNLRLSCNLDAILEGTVVFPKEPLLRIRGPLLECQLLETILLNIINFQSLIATKSARCVLAAQGKEVIDFGLRRAQGPDGGISASRASIIGGCRSTSNVLAGKLFDVPVKGTHAHSWVMVFGDEKEAFRAFSKTYPDNAYLLVDTYHTKRGIENAIQIGKELRAQGRTLQGIRLDSGNLDELSQLARSMLDSAGFFESKIMVSGDLDEYRISELMSLKSPIDAFGVGTRMVTAYDEPALGGVYKLSAIEGRPGKFHSRLKVTDDLKKSTLPGVLQTRRYLKNGKIVGDLIFEDTNEDVSFKISNLEGAKENDLLVNVLKNGSRTLAKSKLVEAQFRAEENLLALHPSILQLKNPSTFDVWIDPKLVEKQRQLMSEEYQ